jgi:rubrerythrin
MTGGSLKMLATALEMERRGRKFYEDAVAKASNKVARDIFEMLGKDEDVHVDRIKVLYAAVNGEGKWTKEWESLKEEGGDLKDVFRKLAAKYGKDINPATSDVDALGIGIDFEQKSVKFYEESLKHAVDPIERKFLEKMIVEEKEHAEVLSDMKFYIEDPNAWFVEHERHGMDGA